MDNIVVFWYKNYITVSTHLSESKNVYILSDANGTSHCRYTTAASRLLDNTAWVKRGRGSQVVPLDG